MVAVPFFAHAQQKTFSINGRIDTSATLAGKVYMYYTDGELTGIDSCQLSNNTYQFEKTINALSIPLKLVWTSDEETGNANKPLAAIVYVQPGNIKAVHAASFANPLVTGSAVHQEFVALVDKLDKAEKPKHEIFLSFVKSNPSSLLAPRILSEQAINPVVDIAVVENLFEQLDSTVKNSAEGSEVAKAILLGKKTAIGKPAADFVQYNVMGKPVSLSSFRGKYVLVDFWASWCMPCRMESTALVKLYKKYKKKKFEIVGVSLDQKKAKAKWLKAIKDDQLAWVQLSDLKGWKNAAALQYGVESIPFNLLVGPDGIILAKALHGEELEKKLAEIFEKP
jgi:peroxiredoxin